MRLTNLTFKEMVMKYLMLCVALILASCGKAGTPVETDGAVDDFKVERLFEKDGVTVYRFRDHGHFHYFTSAGEAIGVRRQSCGKNCTRHVEENIRAQP